MSTFGDHTPAEDLLGWIQYVQSEHNLSILQMIAIICRVLNYLIENELPEG